MTDESREPIATHNEAQRQYFGAGVRRTMVPVDTPYVRRQVDEVLQFGGLTPGMRVLEVGCGMGRHAFQLARRGFHVEGVELAPFHVEQFRRFDGGRYGIDVHCGDMLSLPATYQGRFDAVVGFFMLHHLFDLRASFAAARDLVTPGGVVVFIEPNPYNPLYYAQVLLTPGMRWRAERGLLQMRRSVIAGAMAGAGLVGFRMSRYGFLPPQLANTAAGAWIDRRIEAVPPLRPVLPFQLFRGNRPC